MDVAVRMRSGRGIFFASHHPWVALVVVVILVLVVLYLARRDS